MQSQEAKLGAYKVSLVLDDDGHLSVYSKSTDGSPLVDITDERGGDDEVCLRLTTEKIEKQAHGQVEVVRNKEPFPAEAVTLMLPDAAQVKAWVEGAQKLITELRQRTHGHGAFGEHESYPPTEQQLLTAKSLEEAIALITALQGAT